MSNEHSRCGTSGGVYDHRKAGEQMCDACKLHRRRYEKRRRIDAERHNLRLVSSIGVRRRCQALQRLGWSLSQIAERAGWDSPQALQYAKRNQSIIKRTHERVAAVYEELSMTIPPFSSGSVRARNRAIRLGYAPPLAWDDIDDPNEHPNLGDNTKRDTLAEYEHLTSCGVSRDQALQQLGITLDGLEQAQRRERRAA